MPRTTSTFEANASYELPFVPNRQVASPKHPSLRDIEAHIQQYCLAGLSLC